MAFEWNFQGYDRAPAQPAVTMPQQAAQAAYDASRAAVQQNMQDQFSIESEIKQNEARIQEIRAEIARLESSGKDDMDLALARNRAQLGDISGSMLHQGRIQQRAETEAGRKFMAEQARLARLENRKYMDGNARKDLQDKIEEIDRELAFVKDEETYAKLSAMRQRYVNELAEKGVQYRWKDEGPARLHSDEVPDEYRDYPIYDGEFLHDTARRFETDFTDKNGVWKSPEAKEYYDAHYHPKTSDDAADKKAALDGKTQPQVDAARAKRKKEGQDAIAEFLDPEDLEYLTIAKKTSQKATNGVAVDIEPTATGWWVKANGEKKFVKR